MDRPETAAARARTGRGSARGGRRAACLSSAGLLCCVAAILSAPAAVGHAVVSDAETVLVCTAQRMAAVGPRSLAKTRSVDEIRDIAMKRRYASVEEPRFREFIATVAPLDEPSRLARDLASACGVIGNRDPVCRLVPRYGLVLPAEKVASADRDAQDDNGLVALTGATTSEFRGRRTTFSISPEGLFSIVRRAGIDGVEVEEGRCAGTAG